MNAKPFYKTTTFWSALAMGALHVMGDAKNPVTWGESAAAVLAATRLRAAVSKNGQGQ